MADKYIYVKLIKEWGGFRVGDVVRFGWNKGMGRIEKKEGIEVKKQHAVNDPPEPKIEKPLSVAELKIEAKPVIETATAEPAEQPRTETAEVTPRRRGRPSMKNSD
jgi:hypothetical protein